MIPLVRAKISSWFCGLFRPLANPGSGMPLSTSALRKPCRATTGHNSGGASSTLGQPNRTAVSQIRSISHCHSVAFRHQYASDCLIRPFVTTRLLLQTCPQPQSFFATFAPLRETLFSSSDPPELGHRFPDGFELLDEGH